MFAVLGQGHVGRVVAGDVLLAKGKTCIETSVVESQGTAARGAERGVRAGRRRIRPAVGRRHFRWIRFQTRADKRTQEDSMLPIQHRPLYSEW